MCIISFDAAKNDTPDPNYKVGTYYSLSYGSSTYIPLAQKPTYTVGQYNTRKTQECLSKDSQCIADYDSYKTMVLALIISFAVVLPLILIIVGIILCCCCCKRSQQ